MVCTSRTMSDQGEINRHFSRLEKRNPRYRDKRFCRYRRKGCPPDRRMSNEQRKRKEAKPINGYMIDAADVFIENRKITNTVRRSVTKSIFKEVLMYLA